MSALCWLQPGQVSVRYQLRISGHGTHLQTACRLRFGSPRQPFPTGQRPKTHFATLAFDVPHPVPLAAALVCDQPGCPCAQLTLGLCG